MTQFFSLGNDFLKSSEVNVFWDDSQDSSWAKTRFISIVDVLLSESSASESKGHGGIERRKVLCNLASRLAVEQGRSLLELLLHRTTLDSPVAVDILASTACWTNDSDVADFVCKHFIEGVSHLGIIRERMIQDDDLFGRCSMQGVERMVDKLVGLGTKEDTEDALSCLTTTLRRVFRSSSTSGNAKQITRILLDQMSRVEKRPGIEPIVANLCQRWRQDLLHEEGYADSHYADVAVALIQEMMNAPSKVEPLMAFGWMAQEENGVESPFSPAQERRISVFVARAAEACTTDFELLKKTKSLQHPDIFERLCPLLILRRIPSQYYQIARTSRVVQEPSQLNFASISVSLSIHLVDRLRPCDDEIVQVSPEERKLAAEVIARLLPLVSREGIDDEGSLYASICYPYLVKLSEHPKQLCDVRNVPLWRSVRVSLFVACSSMVESKNVEETGVVLSMVVACLKLIEIDAESFNDESLLEEAEKLHAGCCDFFAMCFIKLFAEKQLVDSALEQSSQGNYTKKACYHLLGALREATDRGAAIPRCIWNSIVLAATRIEEGKTFNLSHFILPWMFRWKTEASQSEKRWHDFDTWASMKLIFTLITRQKSSGLFPHTDPKISFEIIVSWTLDVVRNRKGEGALAVKARTEAFKVLLVLIGFGPELSSSGRWQSLMADLRDIHMSELDAEFVAKINSTISMVERSQA